MKVSRSIREQIARRNAVYMAEAQAAVPRQVTRTIERSGAAMVRKHKVAGRKRMVCKWLVMVETVKVTERHAVAPVVVGKVGMSRMQWGHLG